MLIIETVFAVLQRKGIFISRKQQLSKYLVRKAKTYHFIGQYFAKKLFSNIVTKLPFVSQWYTKHFPAVRLNQSMSPLEYGLNFSSEILVAIFVVMVAGLNVVIFNPFTSNAAPADKSLAAHLLRYHTGLNNQLAIKHNTVSTSVSGNGGLISQAFADQSGSVLGATDTIEPEATDDGIEDNGINKANPDTIQKLVSAQVKIIETEPFDTVYTVAAKYGVTPKTIRESNGLTNNALKAGWFLVIPPVDGIVVKIDSDGLTVSDLAEKYNADVEKVASYNGLGPDSELEKGEYLIIPGGVLPEPAKPAAAPSTPGTPAPKASKPSVPKAAFVSSNKFAAGQCTAYVASKVKVYWRGNANMWATNAKKAGATVDKNPSVGAIIQTNESRWGHVGVIESVSGTKVTFGEWNYAGPYKYTRRTLDINDAKVKAIIHP